MAKDLRRKEDHDFDEWIISVPLNGELNLIFLFNQLAGELTAWHSN